MITNNLTARSVTMAVLVDMVSMFVMSVIVMTVVVT